MHEAIHSDALDSLKVSPPLFIWIAHFMGWGISDWVQFITFIYLIVMISHKIWMWRKEVEAGKITSDGD